MLPVSLSESLRNSVPLVNASRLFPGNPSISTMYRWATKGTRGVKLQTWFSGGTRVTTSEAVEQFLTALNAGSPAFESESDRTRRAQQAGRALEAIGA